MSIKICRECRHYAAIHECSHPDLLDLVTGEPSDCHWNRGMIEGAEATPPLPWCGPAGALWEERPAGAV